MTTTNAARERVEALSPCPFCGSEAKYVDHYWYEGNSAGDYVICTGCSARNRPRRLTNEPDARTAWNTRALLATPTTGRGEADKPRKLTMPNGDVLTCDYPESADWAKSWSSRNPQGLGATQEQDWEIVETYGLTAIANAMLQATPPAQEGMVLREGMKVRVVETGETGQILRVPYIVQADEDDGSHGNMGGTKWIGEFAANELEALSATPAPEASAVVGEGQGPSRYHFTDARPFIVQTMEGNVFLDSGWLAITEAEYRALSAPAAGGEIARLREAGQFLLDRLVDHEVRMTSEEDSREWHGHVTPAMARFRAALSGGGEQG